MFIDGEQIVEAKVRVLITQLQDENCELKNEIKRLHNHSGLDKYDEYTEIYDPVILQIHDHYYMLDLKQFGNMIEEIYTLIKNKD